MAPGQSSASPRVSVVTPVFNRVSYLPALAAMLSRQTFRDFEWVIADDASTDGLHESVAALATDYAVTYVRLDRNRGAATARNAGIDRARGEYVALLDSDDSWHPDKLRCQVDQLQNAPDGERLVSLTRQIVIGGQRQIVPARMMTRADDVGSYLFLYGGVIQSSMMMLRRDLAARVRFEEGSRGHDDWSFALRLEKEGIRFEMLPEPLTIYDDTADRPRRSPAYSSARLDWLSARRNQLGERAYWAAVAAVASHLPASAGVNPLHLIAAARRNRAISLGRAGYYALAWGFPPARKLARSLRAMSASQQVQGD